MKKTLFTLPAILTLFAVGMSALALASAPAMRAAEKTATPALISQGGATITLADHLVAGKTTVFDFFSTNCPPCATLAPALEKLHAARDGIAVVKIDIDRAGPGIKRPDLESPVSRQFNLRTLPHIKIYAADGKLLAEGGPAMDIVLRWLDSLNENPFKGFSRTW